MFICLNLQKMEMKSEKVVCGCDVEKKKKKRFTSFFRWISTATDVSPGSSDSLLVWKSRHAFLCTYFLRIPKSPVSRPSSDFPGKSSPIRSSRVETVRADPVANKLTLIGFMDPVKTAEKLQKETKKKVELLSPKPKNETKDAKADVKTTMIAVSTVTLKLSCSCDGCIKRIHKTISKTKGVYQVKIDREKDVVSVTGTMEVKTVTETLKRKLKKTIQVVPENKDKKKESAEGISKSGSPGLPCYGFGYGLGPYGFMGGPTTELFSEEDPNSCCIV
ncbi:hypothetical protein Bca52824_010138 [Brassica carinata]|uniref:HMA domain-containing protein n=1 Tax=Brassica carinata TaxID=52824 RepID=A0A8X7WDY4_BRACI|nr:hypothetical protein Bca52824_010138 [Brassica carinata]